MELPPLHEIADVLAGALEQPACACRIRHTVCRIALKITDRKRYCRTVLIKPIRSDIKVLTPGDPIPIRLDLHRGKQLRVLQDRYEPRFRTQDAHIAFSCFAVSEEDQHLRVFKRHRFLDPYRETVPDLLRKIAFLKRFQIAVVLRAAALRNRQEGKFIVGIEAVFLQDAAEVLPVRRDDALLYLCLAPIAVDCMLSALHKGRQQERRFPFVSIFRQLDIEPVSLLVIKKVSYITRNVTFTRLLCADLHKKRFLRLNLGVFSICI